MKAPVAICVSTAILTVSTALAQSTVPRQPPPQAKGVPPAVKPAPAPAPASAPAATDPDDPWEERKTRAREDVEYLEALSRAKQTECREVELRVRHALAFKSDTDRQKLKGYTSTYVVNQSDMSVAAAQSELELRRAELKDVEIRLARARRRLKAIERSPSALEVESSQVDDRLRDLELKYERLRRELEQSKRVIDHKTRPGQAPPPPPS